METTIKITESQKRALELVKELADQGKITASEAIVLIIGIYENEKEFVYIPCSNPDPSPYRPWSIDPNPTIPNTIPWWEQNKIMCDGGNANSTQGRPDLFTYAISGPKRNPFNWTIDSWIG